MLDAAPADAAGIRVLVADDDAQSAPKVDLRCSDCGYGVVARTPPERCPMCGGDGRWSKSPVRTGRAATLDDRLAG